MWDAFLFDTQFPSVVFCSYPKQASYRSKISESITGDFLKFGPLQDFLDDPEVTEIMVNGPYRIYIEKKGRKELSRVRFDDEDHLKYIIECMLRLSQKRLDEAWPQADFTLRHHERVNVVIPPLAVGGSVVTIRKMFRTISGALMTWWPGRRLTPGCRIFSPHV